MKVPTDYTIGYKKARAIDPERADNYIAHTQVGDPVMDAVVEDLAQLPQRQVHQFIQAGMQEDHDGLRNAPQLLRDFFIDTPQPDPDWLDRGCLRPGRPRVSKTLNPRPFRFRHGRAARRLFDADKQVVRANWGAYSTMASGGSGRITGIRWRYSGLVG